MKPAILSYPIQAHYVVAVSDRVDKNVSRCTLEMISAFELVNRICDKKRITILPTDARMPVLSLNGHPHCCHRRVPFLRPGQQPWYSWAWSLPGCGRGQTATDHLALDECVTPSSTIQQGNLGHNLGDPVKRDHSVKVLWPFQISNQGVGQAALLRGPEASDHHGVSHLYLWWPAPERGNCLVDCSCCGGQERFRPRSSGWPPWSWRGPPSTSSISTLITITWSHLSYPGMQGLLWLQRWRLTRLFQLTRAWSSSTSSCPTPSSWNRTQQSQRRSRESVLSRWESLQHPRVSFSDLR